MKEQWHVNTSSRPTDTAVLKILSGVKPALPYSLSGIKATLHYMAKICPQQLQKCAIVHVRKLRCLNLGNKISIRTVTQI